MNGTDDATALSPVAATTAAAAGHEPPLLPPGPPASAVEAQAEAWRTLLVWAADAPPRYRQALATLLEMISHATPNSRSAAAIKAGAASLNAVTMKEALE